MMATGGGRRRVSRRELLALGAAALPVLAGCGRASGPVAEVPANAAAARRGSDRIELSYWTGFTGDDGPTMLELVDRFNRGHPGIRVRMNIILWDQYYQKTPAAVYSGRGPDVGVMQADQIATNAAHKIILPLDEVAEQLHVDSAQFPDQVARAGTYRGRRYGIPLDLHPLGMYVNQAVLAKAGLKDARPPADRDEYLDMLGKIKAKGVQGSWVTPFLFTGSLMFQSLLYQFGGTLYSDDGTRATWSGDAGVEALGFMVDLVKRGFSPPSIAQDADNVAFMNGENAFIWNGPWAVNQYGGLPDFKWAVAPVPKIGPERATWANSHQFVIMRQAERDEARLAAAVTFIDWLSRNSAGWAKAGMVPARRSERESPAFRKLKPQQAFAKEIAYARFTPSFPGASDVRAVTLDLAIQNAVLGKQSPRAALQEGAQRAKGLLEANRRKYGEA
jgi:multiple sugar transport system substrate-binding protein